MKLSKLEGDAVFVYMPGNRVDAGSRTCTSAGQTSASAVA
jgi:hypothetical protein